MKEIFKKEKETIISSMLYFIEGKKKKKDTNKLNMQSLFYIFSIFRFIVSSLG